MIDFLPRDALLTGAAFGDFIDVKLAYAKWERKLGPVRFALSAGKFDALHGLEYRAQEANTRLTVTPSLLCRYTCGRAVGLKAQLFLLDGALEAALALTNGSNQHELFPGATRPTGTASRPSARACSGGRGPSRPPSPARWARKTGSPTTP